ncbi:hypothetical protein LEMLEM_LOCUS6859 [Lemmus lemmus]
MVQSNQPCIAPTQYSGAVTALPEGISVFPASLEERSA